MISKLLRPGSVQVPPHAFWASGDRLSYAAFEEGPKGRRLLHEAQVLASPDWFGQGVLGGPISDEASFDAALDSLLAKLPETPTSASLVLPGEWVRTTYIDLDQVPSKASELDEVVQWKLRQVVPFRVDDVRISYQRVPTAEGANRFLVAFAINRFLQQLETTFASRGIHIGMILPVGLALFELLNENDGLRGILWGGSGVVSLLIGSAKKPALLRYRSFTAGSAQRQESQIRRDLRLSRSWMDDHTDGQLTLLSIAAPDEDRRNYAAWCREDLGAATVKALNLSDHNLPAGIEWRLAPLLGAVERRVA